MRGGDGPTSPQSPSQGLTQLSPLRYTKKRLKDLEVTERKQVGDTEALVNQTGPASGFFNRHGEM